MAVTAGAVIPLDAKRRRRQELLAQLREIDHWRRLVAARLDLAVAAVTALEEPVAGPGSTMLAPATGLPSGLRDILGLPVCEQALPEAAVLPRLRETLRELDEYARTLRASTDLGTTEFAALLDAERVIRRIERRAPVRAHHRSATHLHSVTDLDPLPPASTARSTDRTP